MKVDVIVPTFNNLPQLQRCLASLQAQTFCSFRVLVCVDGSADGTQAWLHQAKLNLNLQVLEHADGANHGRNAARNLALPHLDSDILAMLDSDQEASPHWLQAHLDLLHAHQGACVSLGQTLYQVPNPNPWVRYISTRGKAKYEHGQEVPFQYFNTQNACLPTRCFAALGGQDDAMRSYGGGDTEFAWRLHRAFGLPVFYNMHAGAYATEEKDLNRALQQMEEFGRINLPHIRQKHPNFGEIYHIDWLLKPGWAGALRRVLLGPPFRQLARQAVRLVWGRLQRGLVHYLTVAHVLKGWKKRLK